MTYREKQDFSSLNIFILKIFIAVFALISSTDISAQTVSTLYENTDQRGWAYGVAESSFSFTLDYTIPSTNLSQTEELRFGGFIKTGGVNGFRVVLNGSTILTIPEYSGQAGLNTFSISLTGKLVDGENAFSIQSTSSRPIEDYNWGLTNIRVLATTTILTSPDLAMSNVSIASDSLVANTPFQIEATVSNIGEGISEATNVQFYLSEDETIDEQDTEIGTSSVVSLNGSENAEISVDIELDEIDSSLYYGACVVVVSEETSTDNNCSTGLEFTLPETEATPIIVTPILLLLLN